MAKCAKCGEKVGLWWNRYEIETDEERKILSLKKNDKFICNNCFEKFEEKLNTKENKKAKEDSYSSYEFDENKQIKIQYVKIKNPIILGMMIAIGFIIIFILLIIISNIIGFSILSAIFSGVSQIG
jgi:DNA-directed RNA polymerase subunit RPC12/RpoP